MTPLDLPTELRPGADRLTTFAAACATARAGIREAAPDGVEAALVAILRAHGVRTAALAADLGPHLAAARAACAGAGVAADDYATVAPDRARLGALDAGITGCAAALAPTGSILTTASAGRGAALVPPLHVCVVRAEQVRAGLAELLADLPGLGAGSLAALQTGPSRTADIEKVLVIGAHGPRAVEVVLVREGTAAG